MITTIDNLRAGILWWNKQNWGADFVNDDYYDIYNARSAGTTAAWWTLTVDRLWEWKAIRAPKPPNTKYEITQRGLACLAAIATEHGRLRQSSQFEPSINDLDWERVSPLFNLASTIKPGPPVLASKMCHFLFPKLFPVMDNKATGLWEYEFYWRGMKDEWERFDQKSVAINMLTLAIQGTRPLHSLYPFETKIPELALIGYNCRL